MSDIMKEKESAEIEANADSVKEKESAEIETNTDSPKKTNKTAAGETPDADAPNYDILKWDVPEANSVREEIKHQNEKAAKLPFKKKMEHFWYYYKVPVFVLIGILAFATYLILHFTVFAPKPYAFSAYAINSAYVKDITTEEENDLDRFLDGFNQQMNFDLTKTRSEINAEITISPGSTDNLALAYDMNLTAAGLDGDIDILIGSGDIIDYYVPGDFYQDTIDHYLPADFYEYLKSNDLIYSYHNETDGKDYEVGIFIAGAKRMPETGLYEGTNIDAPVAAICTAHSPRIDTAVAFLEYLFDFPACAE